MSIAAFSSSGSRRSMSDGLFVNPARPAIVGVGIVLLFVGTFMAWSWFAPVAGAVTADGALSVEGQRQSVQHPYGGVIKDLLVKEGDVVSKGQVLMTLSDTEPRSQLDVLLVERDGLLAQEGRLIAERDGLREPAFETSLADRRGETGVAQAMANERSVMQARVHQYEAETNLLKQRIGLLEEQKRGVRAQLDGLVRQAELIEEEAKGTRHLLESGLTPKTRVLELERTAAGLRADQGARLSDIAALEESIGSADLEIARLDRTRTAEVTDDLRTVQKSLAELSPKIDAAEDVLTRTRLTAPASGQVVGLSVFTRGGVIQQGARLLDIVPRDNPLIVEARLRLTDANEVILGRDADVRLTNYNRNERPSIGGKIETVSADRLTDERSGEGYYSVLVRMNPDDVERAKVELQAGMPAQVVITTRPRTLVDYLIAPLIDQITGAFHEK